MQHSMVALVMSIGSGNRWIGAALRAARFVTVEKDELAEGLSYLEEPDAPLVVVVMQEREQEQMSTLIALRHMTDVPIVLIGSNDRRARVRGLAFGADAYLDREVPTMEFLARVRALVRRFEFTRSVYHDGPTFGR